MKKVKYLTLFVGLLVLTGCSERALTFDRVYPDMSILEEASKKRQLELEFEKVIDKKRPRSLGPTDTMRFSANVTQFCWVTNLEDCESLQPIHPNEYSDPTFKLYYLSVAANEKISMGFGISNYEIVPFPARIEAYIYDENNNLHLHEVIENPGKTFEITAPSNLGSYVFQFKAYYEGDVEGISYHPHGITVIAAE